MGRSLRGQLWMQYDPRHDPLFAGLDWDAEDGYEPGQLTKRQRQATMLRARGLNQAQIGRELGISVVAAKRLMRVARTKGVFCFQCERCQNEVETETLVGECPHCHTKYELKWQAECTGRKAKLINSLE